MSSSLSPISTKDNQTQQDNWRLKRIHYMDAKSSRAPELPSSVIIEILRRLPIKTLAHCRYVCKAWYTMLSEIYFYKLYSTHAPTCLMIQVKGDSVDSLRDIYIMESTDDSVNSRKVHINLNQDNNNNDNQGEEEASDDLSTFKYQLGNSCNGLICLRELRTREPIAIWNPIMGQYVVLPQPVEASDNKVVAGFGFSPRTKVYKVLRIFHEKSSPAEKLAVEIYDFGVSSTAWRRIGDAPCSIPSRIPGCFVNSSLHWILDRDSVPVLAPTTNQLICSFDFGDESFRYVSPPPIFSLDEKKYHWSNLGILAGCLSICAIDAKVFRPDVEVWVMDDYGVSESWVKKLSIRDPAVDWWDPYRWIQLINFLKNGDIILLCGHRYVLAYDPRARTFVVKEGFDFPAIAHVLSFVSLKNSLREDDPSAVDVKYL